MTNTKNIKCSDAGEAGTSVYTMRDGRGESQDVVVCQRHGELMPLIDDDLVTARPSDAPCEFGTRQPTIYEALRDKLGRAPTNQELKADVNRVLGRSGAPSDCACPPNGCNDTMAPNCRRPPQFGR